MLLSLCCNLPDLDNSYLARNLLCTKTSIKGMLVDLGEIDAQESRLLVGCISER